MQRDDDKKEIVLCYAIQSNICSKISEGRCKGDYISRTKWLLLMLFLVILVLILGTICACIAFAVEITKLKSKADISSPAVYSQQDLSEALKKLNSSLMQQLNAINSSSSASIQQLNSSLDHHLTQDFPALIHQFNASISSLSNGLHLFPCILLCCSPSLLPHWLLLGHCLQWLCCACVL